MTVHGSVLQSVAVHLQIHHLLPVASAVAVSNSVLLCVAAYCSVGQCVAVRPRIHHQLNQPLQ